VFRSDPSALTPDGQPPTIDRNLSYARLATSGDRRSADGRITLRVITDPWLTLPILQSAVVSQTRRSAAADASRTAALRQSGPLPSVTGTTTGLRLLTLRQESIPGMAGLGLDLGEPHARRRIGNTHEMLASGALNLPAGELGFGLQRLVAMRTIEFEFGCIHNIHQLLYSQA
jgi:hypothetical protein